MGTTRDTWTPRATKKSASASGRFTNGTLVVANAQAVPVTLGRELSGVDFSMVPGRVATVSGTGDVGVGRAARLRIDQPVTGVAGPNMSSSFGFRREGERRRHVHDQGCGSRRLQADDPDFGGQGPPRRRRDGSRDPAWRGRGRRVARDGRRGQHRRAHHDRWWPVAGNRRQHLVLISNGRPAPCIRARVRARHPLP
jgi:hypothetical protein